MHPANVNAHHLGLTALLLVLLCTVQSSYFLWRCHHHPNKTEEEELQTAEGLHLCAGCTHQSKKIRGSGGSQSFGESGEAFSTLSLPLSLSLSARVDKAACRHGSIAAPSGRSASSCRQIQRYTRQSGSCFTVSSGVGGRVGTPRLGGVGEEWEGAETGVAPGRRPAPAWS